MIAHGRGCIVLAMAVCCAALALVGCGADGTSSVYKPPQNPASSISGTVYAPNDQGNEAPVINEENVALSKLNGDQAAHGHPEIGQVLLANGSTDPANGQYSIYANELANVQSSEKASEIIVQVGSGGALTRAFILSCATAAPVSCTADIDAVSEALVRLVMGRLTEAPAVELKYFTRDGLQQVDDYARQVAGDVSGASVSEINDNAYNLLANNKTIHTLIEEAIHTSATP